MQNGSSNNESSTEQDFNKLIEATSIITDPKLRLYVVDFLKNKTPKYFRHIPASSSGNFHPAYAQGEGGLIRHTLAAVYFANEISKLEFLRFSPKERNQILAALFLHDTFKQGESDEGAGKTLTGDHAKIAADKIEDEKIATLVRVHMGQWGTNKPGDLQQFVAHLADFLASRKGVSVNI